MNTTRRSQNTNTETSDMISITTMMLRANMPVFAHKSTNENDISISLRHGTGPPDQGSLKLNVKRYCTAAGVPRYITGVNLLLDSASTAIASRKGTPLMTL